jgi:hypothetical protein
MKVAGRTMPGAGYLRYLQMFARYNPMKPMNPTWWRANVAVAAIVLMLSAAVSAADWSLPAAKLAREIVAISGPGAVSIAYKNVSSLPAADVDVARLAIERNLRAGGVRLTAPESAAANIQITFSENMQGYVWVAEVQQGSDTRAAMVTADRTAAAASVAPVSSMTVRKTLLWSQLMPILDVAVAPAGNDDIMLVLDPAQGTVFKKLGGSWQAQQSMGIVRDRPWPRDLRGRLAVGNGHMFDAYLPGMICSSSGSGQLTMTCRGSDDPWPLAPGQSAFFSPARNFFTGAMSPALGKQGTVPAFYSAAAIRHPTYTLWVFARTDGSVYAFDGVNNIPFRGMNWGSSVAVVHSACGGGTQLLATGAADQTMPDTVRTFEVADRSPLEAAVPAEFTGPVTALWTASGGGSAIAVVHNLQLDRYDAYELTINCGQ